MNVNKKKEGMRAKAHANYMGGRSYDLSPFATLYMISCSSFFGEPAYYSDVRRGRRETEDRYVKYFGSFGKEFEKLSSKNRVEAFEEAVDKALDYDQELTIKFLGWLRNEALIRTSPQVALAIASHHPSVKGTGLVTDNAQKIFSRLDDVAACLSYYINKYGKPIPNSLKKAMKKRLERANEYELAKYRKEKNMVSTQDVVRLVHAHSEAIDKLMANELRTTNAGIETWEGIISAEGSSKATWEKAVQVMGHMALLRNLRNLETHEVDTDLYLQKLIDGVEKGKQLPFRYYSAYQNVTSAKIKRALETCMDKAVANLPKFEGKSLILVDNSGSARGGSISACGKAMISTAGNLMGVLTAMVSGRGSKVGVFGDRIEYMPLSEGSQDVLGTLKTIDSLGAAVGMATENGIWLALKEAIDSGEWYDRIFIFSDQQAGSRNGLYGINHSEYNDFCVDGRYIDVPKLVSKYRSEVNKDCYLYSVQIAGYTDNIFPEMFPNTCLLSGWSSELLKFAKAFECDPKNIETMFREKLMQ